MLRASLVGVLRASLARLGVLRASLVGVLRALLVGVLQRASLVGVLRASLLFRVVVLRASQLEVGVPVLRATESLVDVTVLLNDSCLGLRRSGPGRQVTGSRWFIMMFRRRRVSRLLVKVGTWHKFNLKSCRRFKFRSCGRGD